MSKEPGRKALHAYVTEDAHEQWHGFAAEEGVSVSAILEAFAPALHSEPENSEDRSVELGSVVIDARRIDAARRRRTQ